MNSDSSCKLRNGKTISKIPRLSLVTPNSTAKITDMDNPELTQSSSQDHLAESQRELENKVDSLKGEIDGVKSLLERLIQQGEQRSVRSSHRNDNERNLASSSDREARRKRQPQNSIRRGSQSKTSEVFEGLISSWSVFAKIIGSCSGNICAGSKL